MDTNQLIDKFNAEGFDRTQITREWYSARLKRYLEFLHDNNIKLNQSGPAQVKQFLASLHEQGFSWSTRNGSRTALSVFYRWAVNRGYTKINPFEVETIKRPRKPRRIKESLELGAVQLVLDTIRNTDNLQAKRDYALILLMIDTGIRRMEAVGLNIGNVNLERSSISILIAKGDNQRGGYISQATKHALEQWLAIHPRNKANFPLFISLRGPTMLKRLSERTVNTIFTAWSNEAGLTKPVKPHDLRRLFATIFASSGGGMNILQDLLGHENMETTMGYIITGEHEKQRQHTRHSPINFLNLD